MAAATKADGRKGGDRVEEAPRISLAMCRPDFNDVLQIKHVMIWRSIAAIMCNRAVLEFY